MTNFSGVTINLDSFIGIKFTDMGLHFLNEFRKNIKNNPPFWLAEKHSVAFRNEDGYTWITFAEFLRFHAKFYVFHKHSLYNEEFRLGNPNNSAQDLTNLTAVLNKELSAEEKLMLCRSFFPSFNFAFCDSSQDAVFGKFGFTSLVISLCQHSCVVTIGISQYTVKKFTDDYEPPYDYGEYFYVGEDDKNAEFKNLLRAIKGSLQGKIDQFIAGIS
ncbi:MAG: hypothetical protein WCD18_01720 [Thermosynechococcaceae cyanobacterium]